MAEYIITEHSDYPYEEPKPQELIRCKDCRYHTDNGYCHKAEYYGVFTKNEHYCGYAKRKEGECE